MARRCMRDRRAERDAAMPHAGPSMPAVTGRPHALGIGAVQLYAGIVFLIEALLMAAVVEFGRLRGTVAGVIQLFSLLLLTTAVILLVCGVRARRRM
jgi:hypothetical protein